MNCFRSADIMLPRGCAWEKWSVVACDQYTSQPEYWARVAQTVGDAPSTLHLILPEAALGGSDEAARIAAINRTMEDYLASDLMETLPNSYVYVERTLSGGRVRRGLIGCVDLEAYDWHPGSTSAIRATEGTVAERLPPRIRVREHAPMELPHVLMLADDADDLLLAPIAAARDSLRKLYDFELMEGGGHIAGWQVKGEQAAQFDARLAAFTEATPRRYPGVDGTPMVFAVGDGNHSLATAKACWEARKPTLSAAERETDPARFALVELENIHDPALEFEPIHRVITQVNTGEMLCAIRDYCAEEGYPVRWITNSDEGVLYLDRTRSALAVGVLQSFLDSYNQGITDYIHGEDVVRALVRQPDSIGFLLENGEKSQLFRSTISDGALPRKTFSMGHAHEKRFYLEGRRIR